VPGCEKVTVLNSIHVARREVDFFIKGLLNGFPDQVSGQIEFILKIENLIIKKTVD
jgi:hypothetical protein